jgi:hypothetical protein
MSSNALKAMPIVAACLAVFFAGNALAVENPIPKEILEITMGSPIESVAEKISSSGTNTRDSGKRRPKLFWTLPPESYYETVEFQFTEKDRLFLIHFYLKGTRRDDFQELKKAFFNNYNVSWEDPMRMRIKDSDTLCYQPEKGDIFFFEYTGKQNGEKGIELFDKRILAQDRTAYEAEKKAEVEKAKQVKEQEPGQEKKEAGPATADQGNQSNIDAPKPADQNAQPTDVKPTPADEKVQVSPAEPKPQEGESPKAPQ